MCAVPNCGEWEVGRLVEGRPIVLLPNCHLWEMSRMCGGGTALLQ